jgi:NAD-dependent deacetylase
MGEVHGIVILTGRRQRGKRTCTFRGPDGCGKGTVEDVATPEAFARDPGYPPWQDAKLDIVEPNAAHLALARLDPTKDLLIITQNVDDLHERAEQNGCHCMVS